MDHPKVYQERLLKTLLKSASWTEWGRMHQFNKIRTPEGFSQAVNIQDYSSLEPFIERMMHGERDVLWHGQVRWFSKSSGTTNGKSKFIPVTSQNLKSCHIRGTWDTMTMFYHNRPDARQFECKSLVMGGSLQRFESYPKSFVGDVSAIMIHSMPYIGRPFYTPDFKTALLPDFEEKLERLAEICSRERNIVMIGGVPTWTVVLLRKILDRTGRSNMLEVWPHFQGYIHGGVSFVPYRKQFQEFFPSEKISYQEIYNASEGYFGIQNDFGSDDLLLLLDNGVYYEFIPTEEWNQPDPQAIPLWEVEKDRNYALVISTNSGLWRYMPGDTVKFTSTSPYKIKITGRTKQFINAFGEEVIVENAEMALAMTCGNTGALVSEYTVAPIYLAGNGKGGHQWIIEFEKEPSDLSTFATLLDRNLQKLNSDYEAKRFKDLALENLVVKPVPVGSFHNWLKSKGKLGGQSKVPRLANHRRYAEDILSFVSKTV